jgi:hypothetical protein
MTRFVLFCDDSPCVWVAECDSIIALIATEHCADSRTISNSTCRKTSFRYYIWQGRNGIGQKNVRTMETDIRALFPDIVLFMGFKEE